MSDADAPQLRRRSLTHAQELPSRIGINAVFLEPGMGGLDTYVRELMPELVRAAPRVRFTIFCGPRGERHLRESDWADDVEFVNLGRLGGRGLKAISELTTLGAMASRRVELIHSVALTAPLRTRAASVITIADVTWMMGQPQDATTRLWRLIVPPVARRANRVIAISHAAADDVARSLGIPRDRIDVTLLGHSIGVRRVPLPEAEVRRRFGLGRREVALMVGTRKPHKNVLRLLAAMPAVIAAHPEVILVLVGNPTKHEHELLAEARRLQLDDHVRFLPFVEQEELEGLYGTARCFVLPSLSEGFGLPVAEAMARDVPVACSNVSALPEVVDGAAQLFDPRREEQIAAAVTEILRDAALRDRLRARGRARVRELTWTATAAATLASYARAWQARSAAATG